MAGKQAKTLSDSDLKRVLTHVRRQSRYPKAGLRACEIAGLTWAMVTDAQGQIATTIATQNQISKGGRGRTLPMNDELRRALRDLRPGIEFEPGMTVVRSERGGAMRANSLVNWFSALYRQLGLIGCSSHSGRRTFITKAARLVFRAALCGFRQVAGASRQYAVIV